MNKFSYVIYKYERFFHIVFSLILLLILFPLLILIASLIIIFNGRPVTFCQNRVGKDVKIFSMYKFRTMTHNAQLVRDGLQVQEGDSRITRLGRILRKTSLDELPQLINMLKGDLSLVGPRACLPEQLPYFNLKHQTRFKIRPGLTGLAVIKGRASIPWSRRLRWDRVYVKHRSVSLDLYIIAMTVLVVLTGRNVYYDQKRHGPAFDLAPPDDLPQSADYGKEK